jgi:hypothetical protein
VQDNRLLDLSFVSDWTSLKNSMLTLCQLLLGEGWHDVMNASMLAFGSRVAIFFVPYAILVSKIFVSLLTGVILSVAGDIFSAEFMPVMIFNFYISNELIFLDFFIGQSSQSHRQRRLIARVDCYNEQATICFSTSAHCLCCSWPVINRRAELSSANLAFNSSISIWR